MSDIKVDSKGFPYCGRVKMPFKVVPGGKIEVCVKDRRVSSHLRTRYITVNISDLLAVDKIRVTN